MKLLKKAMAKSGGSKFLVDGFPRNHDNLDGWHRVVGDEVSGAAGGGHPHPPKRMHHCARRV